MHCPQCGQQQVSDEMRFCKSCGFSLVAVRTLLATDSVSPTTGKEGQKSSQSTRRNGVRQGVILLFIFMVLMPLIKLGGSRQFEFLPMMFLMAGLMRILYAVIFQEGAPRTKKQDGSLPDGVPPSTKQLDTARSGSALPPAQGVPVAAGNARQADTARMVSPPSVTEHTTKLLDESQDSK